MSCSEIKKIEHVGRDEFIAAMRAIANTVAVVTTTGQAGQHGATVSSFCSVSADPPSMLICLHAKSRIANLVEANRTFCLNVLDHEMADVADRFAGKFDQETPDRFSRITHCGGHSGGIHIEGSIGFRCEVQTSQLSGSHLVVIGSVNSLGGSIKRPLTYMDGAYRPWIT